MHALGSYVTDLMDSNNGMSQADLARASGVSKEVISNLLSAARTEMTRPPSRATIEGLGRAFPGQERALWAKVAESLGLPTDTVEIPNARGLTDGELLAELGRRLQLAAPAKELTRSDVDLAAGPARKRSRRKPS